VLVAAANATPVPGLPPQLALALSEGPLGGVRGQTLNLPPSIDLTPPTGSATGILVALATPLVGPTPLLNGGDDTFLTTNSSLAAAVGGSIVGRNEDLPPTVAVWDVAWLVRQTPALAQTVLHHGVGTMESLDAMLASLHAPASPSESLANSGQMPAEAVAPDADLAETAPAPAAPSWTDSLSYGPFWWGAATVLSFVWGAFHGHKWLAGRRERQPTLHL
jgi:hypothetical protein